MYKNQPYEAVFILCQGQVAAGPLRTAQEIQAVFAQIMQADAADFELARRIRQQWPTGCSNCSYRVYDAAGNHLYDQ
jgi:hypothetical protein